MRAPEDRAEASRDLFDNERSLGYFAASVRRRTDIGRGAESNAAVVMPTDPHDAMARIITQDSVNSCVKLMTTTSNDSGAGSPGMTAPRSPAAPGMNAPHKVSESITQNIESIAAFYKREHEKISWSQRLAEKVGNMVARPFFLGGVVVLVVLWILANVCAQRFGIAAFDPAPFFWLQGIVSLLALLTTTVVLIRQERLASLEERREHLDLQVNLLTEQKATKLIHLFEELRKDLPMVKDRHDPESEAMQQHTDPHQVLAGIDEAAVASVPAGPTGAAKPLLP